MDTTARLVCSFVATFDERVGEFSLIVGFLLIVRFLLVSLITSPNHQHSASGIYLFSRQQLRVLKEKENKSSGERLSGSKM